MEQSFILFLPIMVLLVLIFLFTRSIILYIFRYKTASAKIIATTDLYSDEWGTYFPEEYNNYWNKINNIQSKIDSTLKKINPNESIDTNNDGINIKELGPRVFIAEFFIDNHKHYYYNYEIAKEAEEFQIKYDVKKPSKVIDAKSYKKTITLIPLINIFFIFELIFILVYFNLI